MATLTSKRGSRVSRRWLVFIFLFCGAMPTDLSKVDSTDEPKGSSLKIKVFGRRRTAEISALKEQAKFSPTEYQNVKSAIAFILVVVAMVGLCGYTVASLDTSKAKSGGLGSIWTHTATVCSCIGLGLPMVWFGLLCVATTPVYYFSVFGTPAVQLAVGGWLIKSGMMIYGAVDIVIALLWLAYLAWNWKRVVFTKELVRISCGVLARHPALVLFGIVQFIVSCVWSAICFIAILGLAVKLGSPDEPSWCLPSPPGTPDAPSWFPQCAGQGPPTGNGGPAGLRGRPHGSRTAAS